MITPPLQTLSYRGDYLCFDVEVTSNQLWHTHYSPYQSFLHNKIKQLKAEGLGYRKIAKRLNEENIKTSRGNAFYPSSVYSILKKKKIRDERLNKCLKRRYLNFGLNIAIIKFLTIWVFTQYNLGNYPNKGLI
jgi:hypothetical protein